jgi:LysM repeat protein
VVLVTLVSLTLTFSSDLAQADDPSYTVQLGDNLTSIATHYGVSVQALAQANGIANVNNIYAGQILRLPTSTTNSNVPSPVTSNDQAYLVQAGDTLTALARSFNISIYDLAAANHLSVMSYIYTGQTLRIPSSTSKPATITTTPSTATTEAVVATTQPALSNTTAAASIQGGSSYTIQAGDNLSKIATRFNVTVDTIVQANHLSDPSTIFAGQSLIIPSANATSTNINQPNPTTTVSAIATPVVIPTPGKEAASLGANGSKWIDVNLTTETMVAYEGSKAVITSKVSTGVAAHPTVVGTFNVYVKYTSQAMSGPGYYLPNVPYVMYFYQSYALHGTYWHNNFGHPMSHGCVNLPTPIAQQLFNWAVVGTPVHIHY